MEITVVITLAAPTPDGGGDDPAVRSQAIDATHRYTHLARSRSDALAWCVRLVGSHIDEWLKDLRTALEDVERLRASGPGLRTGR